MLRKAPSLLRSVSCQVSQSEVKRLASIVTSAGKSTCNFGNTMLRFLVTWPTFENSKTLSPLELLTVKNVHIICYVLSFPSMFIRWWCYTCEELESIKRQKNWGVFYRCEEYAWMLYEFWGRTYFSHICEILVWNPWHIGTNSSRAVKNWYQLFTMWNLRSVKFTVQQGSFAKAITTLVGKSLKAMNALLAITKRMQVPIDVMSNLFDSFVLSILNYGCEVWGFYNAVNIERVHRKFCKWLINVKMSTNNLSLAGEFGRFPLLIGRHVRIIKYWLNLYNSKHDNCILRTINNMPRIEVESGQKIK